VTNKIASDFRPRHADLPNTPWRAPSLRLTERNRCATNGLCTQTLHQSWTSSRPSLR